MNGTISVYGTGVVAGIPDTLVLDIGISLVRPTVTEASTEGAGLARAVIGALKESGLNDRDIVTANYSIHPEYDHSRNIQRLVGYRVSNTVSARIRDMDAYGDIIDAAVAAGGDSAIVNGIRFGIQEDTALLRAARESAWEDARNKAQQLADLAGVGLGRAVSIAEAAKAAPPVARFARAEMAMDAGSTPIQSGEQEVAVTVTVEFDSILDTSTGNG